MPSFLKVNSNIIGVVDTNNNINKSLYQMISGSWDNLIDQYVLDPYILKLAGVLQELWIIQVYSSNIIVLRIE